MRMAALVIAALTLSRLPEATPFQLLRAPIICSAGPSVARGRVLVVGDGNFSFSCALARILKERGEAAAGITATSLDSREAVLAKYGSRAGQNLEELQGLGCCVKHGVDATVLSASFPQERIFDEVIFQHPILDIHQCEAELRAKLESQERDTTLPLVARLSTRDGYIIANRLLLLDFLLSAEAMLSLSGEIRITVKDVSPYDKWDVGALQQHCSLELRRTEAFDNGLYPGYETMQVQTNVAFPSALSTCFVFGFSEACRGEVLTKSDPAVAAEEALACELCNKVFTGDTDRAKHLSSRKHREAVALMQAWSRTMGARQRECDDGWACIEQSSDVHESGSLPDRARFRFREAFLTGLMLKENRWHDRIGWSEKSLGRK